MSTARPARPGNGRYQANPLTGRLRAAPAGGRHTQEAGIDEAGIDEAGGLLSKPGRFLASRHARAMFGHGRSPSEVALGEGGAAGPTGGRPLPRRARGGVTTPRLSLIMAATSGAVVVRPHPVLDESGSDCLAEILGDLFAGQPNLAVVIDLTKVDRFEVAAIAMFDRAAVAADQRGGTLTLSCPGDDLEAVLATGGLGPLISCAHRPTADRFLPDQATSQGLHPAGRAIPDPSPGTTEPPTPAPNLTCIR